MTPNIVSVLGLFTLLAIAWGLSEDRRRFPWRVVLWGLALQFGFAFLILRTQPGRTLFNRFQDAVSRFIGFASEGTTLVFGPLAKPDLLGEKFGPANALVLAITITGTIILVSAVSSLLYHYGILQRVVRGIAWVMRRAMGTSGSETLAAAANIFMGQTEAPLVIKPYLHGMTRSELFALMTGGMSTIAGGVLAAYVSFGIEAGHLLTASVLSAPASLLIAKILLPESQASQTAGGANAEPERETVNGIDALCHGASDGMKLSINVLAMLIAFTAVIAAANAMVSAALAQVGVQSNNPMQACLGWINAPFAWLMGVPWKDCQTVGSILGERVILNEFVGYVSLAKSADSLDPRSRMITTYALCGFANIASIAIQIGGISALAPNRRKDLASLGLRSMIGGLLACYCTACVAAVVS